MKDLPDPAETPPPGPIPSNRFSSMPSVRRLAGILLLSLLLLSFAQRSLAVIPAGYYDGTDGLTDAALLAKLRQITGSGYVSHSYSASSDEIKETIDLQANNKLTCIYTGNEHTASEINIEHSWPQSRGAESSPRQSDCHHLFPTEPDINSRRGNLPFGTVANPDYEINGSKVEYTVQFEPRDPVKGNIARALFYFAMRYDYPLVNTGYVLGTSEDKMGFENVLRVWHVQDPPDDAERARNDRVYTYQKNRNPFIDHPEFVGRIATFGDQPVPTSTPFPTATIPPTPTDTSGVSPTPTATGTPAAAFDLSGYVLKQNGSTQSYTLPNGTTIQSGNILIVARETDKAGIESAWSTTLPVGAVVVNSGGTFPQINGNETYQLLNPQSQVIDAESPTSTLAATNGQAALRAATNNTTWNLIAAGPSAAPGADTFPSHGAGVVIVKFGEPVSGFAAEYVELYYDVLPPATATPTATTVATGTPTATPVPTDVPSPSPTATATAGPSPTPSATPAPSPTAAPTPDVRGSQGWLSF